MTTQIALTTPYAYQTIHLVKTQPDHAFMDIVATEDKIRKRQRFILARLSKKASQELLKYRTDKGDYNMGRLQRHLCRALMLQGLPAFSRFNIPISGGRSIVNAASKNHGPSWRMIVEMSSHHHTALGIYPGGQSGNPGSRYYDNFIDDWAKGGEYHSLTLFTRLNSRH